MQYTKILCHFDDPNNIGKNECGNNHFSISETLGLTNTNAKFGSALNLTGALKQGLYMKNFPLGGESFTIDFWAFMSGGGNYYAPLFSSYNSENRFMCLERYIWDMNGYQTTGWSYSSNNVLNHWAICYNHTTKKIMLYKNGILQNTSNSVIFTTQANYHLSIGAVNWGSGKINDPVPDSNGISPRNSLEGRIDEFRYSKGICRWTSNFTPPTQQYIYGPYAEFPSNYSGEYITAPNKLKYYYKVYFEQGPYTQTSNVVNYETTRILSVLRKILIINILYKYIRSLNF